MPDWKKIVEMLCGLPGFYLTEFLLVIMWLALISYLISDLVG
jgi:hypothetical protein